MMVMFKLISLVVICSLLGYLFGRQVEEDRTKRKMDAMEDEIHYYRYNLPYHYPGKGRW